MFVIRFLPNSLGNYAARDPTALEKDPKIGWSVSGPADCWYECANSGGKCDFCGSDGYCCSPTKLDLNGDCPSDVAQNLATEFLGDGHQCIAPNTGKYDVSNLGKKLLKLFLDNVVETCEWENLHNNPESMQCPGDDVIEVESAIYGIQGSYGPDHPCQVKKEMRI